MNILLLGGRTRKVVTFQNVRVKCILLGGDTMLLRSYIHEQKESSGIVTFRIPGINVDMSLTYLQGLFEFIEILLLVYSNFYTDSFHGITTTPPAMYHLVAVVSLLMLG